MTMQGDPNARIIYCNEINDKFWKQRERGGEDQKQYLELPQAKALQL